MTRPSFPSDTHAETLATHLDPTGWRRPAWKAYEYLPRSADAFLRFGIRSILPFTNFRVPLCVLRGPVASGGSGTVAVAGAPGPAGYLARRFFTGDPEREFLGDVPSWRLAAELERLRDSVDLVIARLDRVSATLFLGSAWVAVPEWVGGVMSVPDDPWQFAQQSKSMQNNLRRMQRAGFRPLVSHDEQDFHEFFDRMYVPFTRNRHGAQAVLANRARMRRCFRQGGLLWALRDGVRVAGLLFRTRGRTLDVVVIGTENGERGPIGDGVAIALDLFVLEHAKRLGCTLFDFGGSRSSPQDGVLLYKARWGARVVESRTTFYDVCLSWNRLNEALLSFLAHTPLIFRQADGLAALWTIAGGSETVRADITASRSVLRSLRRLYLLGVPPDESLDLAYIETVIIDPARQPDWLPAAGRTR